MPSRRRRGDRIARKPRGGLTISIYVVHAKSWLWDRNQPSDYLSGSPPIANVRRAREYLRGWQATLESRGESGVLAIMDDSDGSRWSAVVHVIPATVPVRRAS